MSEYSMQEKCQHRNFEVKADVGRLQGKEPFKIIGYSMDVKVRCAECLLQFEFMGLPMGVISGGSAMSVDGLEARLSIQPSTQSPAYLAAIKDKKDE